MMELSAHHHHQEATMFSISQALGRIKGATTAFVDAPLIRSLCHALDLGGRQRLLTPLFTTHLFIRQILEGNTPVAELRRLAKVSFADSSYCEAAQRLPVPFFQRLSAAVLDRCRRYTDDDPRALWYYPGAKDPH